jgi:hypothetical protein
MAKSLALAAAILAPLAIGGVVLAHTAEDHRGDEVASPEVQTQTVVNAANAFLATLTAEQRSKALFPFKVQDSAIAVGFSMLPAGGPKGPRRGPSGPGGPGDHGPPGGPGGGTPPAAGEKYGDAVWSNFPVGIVARPGLQLGQLTAPQRAAAMHLLQVTLSAKGFGKIQEIMASDQALADAGTDFSAGRDVYGIGIFGTPSTTRPWMIEFGGHHLGLNVVIAGLHGSMTPTLTGAQPAVFTSGGRTIRVLAGENDKAFALLAALDATQRKAAILNYQVGNLVLGPGHDGETIVPEGLKGSAMTAPQKALMLDLISEWAGIVNTAYAQSRLDEIKADLNDTWFAWSGPTTHADGKNGSAYYRIQGPKLVIEFSPQTSNGDDPTTHVHTVYRDPTNSYGRAYTG